MTDEELCKGLRLLCFIPTTQAADRIEALTAERDEQIEWVRRLADMQIASETKLAKAVELAKEAIETMASGPFFPDEEERRLLSKLAEIEGEKT
jgi:ribosome-binding protein aMBF1 (putative translation factor)